MVSKNIKVLTLNIGNPSLDRAKKQVEWLKKRPEDIFILTETKNSLGCNYIADFFSGYTTDFLCQQENMFVSFPKSPSREYGVMCISRFPIKKSITPFPKNSQFYCRHLGNDICIGNIVLNTVGLYVPSRDQSPEKINRKRVFLKESFAYIQNIENVYTIICGDFNILDRNHFPHYSFFRDWEYQFYDNLTQYGYVDAFKHCYPKVNEYSWVGKTNDGYRYDYCFVSTSLTNSITKCEYLHETRICRLSDHSALSIEISID